MQIHMFISMKAWYIDKRRNTWVIDSMAETYINSALRDMMNIGVTSYQWNK